MAAIGRGPSAVPTRQHYNSTAYSNLTITAVLCSAIAYLNSYWFPSNTAKKQALVCVVFGIGSGSYLLTPWSRVLLEKLTSKLCS